MDTLKDIRSTLNSIRDHNARKVLARLIDFLAAQEVPGPKPEPKEEPVLIPKEDFVKKAEVEATLAEVKDKVEDLMDDGKLNQSNKAGKKSKKGKRAKK